MYNGYFNGPGQYYNNYYGNYGYGNYYNGFGYGGFGGFGCGCNNIWPLLLLFFLF